jgi:exportin-2 (importin alpha re-exporter)
VTEVPACHAWPVRGLRTEQRERRAATCATRLRFLFLPHTHPMADLPALLLGSLQPATRKQAEATLAQYADQAGFLQHLLQLVLTPGADRPVRLAGSVYLKNTVKRKWDDVREAGYMRHLQDLMSTQEALDDGVPALAEQDKAALRSELVPAMIALSAGADKALRAQVAETVSLVATHDFPTRWPSLIDVRARSLCPDKGAADARRSNSSRRSRRRHTT